MDWVKAYVYRSRVWGDHYALLKELKAHFGTKEVSYITAEEIKEGKLDADKDLKLFIMPGGESADYAQELGFEGNEKIRQHIEKGGVYLGICAGAYYACREIAYREGGNLDHVTAGKQETLCMVDALAIGPIQAFEKPDCSCASVIIEDDMGTSNAVMYSDGPLFRLSEAEKKRTQIIASYKDLEGNPAAVLYKNYGKGRVILASPHIEWGPLYLAELIKTRSHLMDKKRALKLEQTEKNIKEVVASYQQNAQQKTPWASAFLGLLDRLLSKDVIPLEKEPKSRVETPEH